MGEVAVSSDCREDMNLVVRETEVEAEAEAQKMKADGSASVVRWERFLPKMVLRVLLVESDDSTRQIIAALLRKCSYRVAAVGDGLKAWELLKGKPQSIDLILTEVDLPSISGFALLTLIMEHEICKNIPVIMMSSHDSVNMVYKCMLRGAADFLVKPVRINELRNLWQHVWRRQASGSSGHGPQDESVAQEKVEATAENNAVSNPSSGYVACVKRNKECIEKGTDAQSSCTKPDLEVESVNTENLHDLLQSKCIKSPENDMNTRKKEECANSNRKSPVHDNEDMGLVVAVNEDINARIQEENVTAEGKRERANAPIEACNNNNAFVSTSREAIDFIGAFNSHPCSNLRSYSSNNVTNMIDPSPMLDLSLRRSHPSGSVNQVNDERHMLNHSDASAFSRYVNRAPQPLHSPASICNQQRDYGTISDRHCSDHTLNYNSDAHTSPLSSQKNIFCSATGQSQQAGVSFPSRQQTVISIPVPMSGTRLDGLCPAYGSAVSPTNCKQSEVSPVQSPGSACHPSNVATKNSQQVYNLIDQNFNNSTKQNEQYQWRKLESSEDRRHFFSAADQSASSSFCNSIAGHLTSIGCGNNGSVDQVAVGSSAAESGNEEGTTVFDKNYHRSVQREAALTKFRLKRKERCFEKKVRYESRKKLAEQRPRVKGQFVRQTHAEPAAVETETQCGI